MTTQSTEPEDRYELPDIAARILMGSHDGRDLTRKEWGLVQCAALNYLNEAGIAEFRKLYEIVKIVSELTASQYYCVRCEQVFEYRDIDQYCCEQCNARIDDDNVAGR